MKKYKEEGKLKQAGRQEGNIKEKKKEKDKKKEFKKKYYINMLTNQENIKLKMYLQ